MKIGIVTWFRSGNFGTNLQALALYHYLGKSNQCYFLARGSVFLDILRMLRFVLRCKMRGIKILRLFRSYSIYHHSSRNKKRLHDFDCFITGSDQIWNPYYLSEFYLLDFVPDSVPRLSYSSSLGVNAIPTETEETYRKNLGKFKNIAVREKTAEHLLKNLLKRNDVRTVSDPVFLLSAEEWREELSIQSKQKDYIFCYFVGSANDHTAALERIRNDSGIGQVVYVPAQEYLGIQLPGKKARSAGVEDFVSYIANAALVCTDSFHATALSLIFSRQFVVFKRFSDNDEKSQNSRITDMLSEYGLNDRLYNDGFTYNPIDYEQVTSLLEQKTAESKRYLQSILDGCK